MEQLVVRTYLSRTLGISGMESLEEKLKEGYRVVFANKITSKGLNYIEYIIEREKSE